LHPQAGGPVLQLDNKPDKKTADPPPYKRDGYVLFELPSSGIRFLVGVAERAEKKVRAMVPNLAARIAADNAVISDPARRVTICFITTGSTRFAYWGTAAVLMLDPADADVATVAHEMGHAIMDAMVQSGKTAAAGRSATTPDSTGVPARIADLFLRLQSTKTAKDSNVAVGVLMVDPPEWSKANKSEHPWQDADEFFASAKAAYQTNLKGLQTSITRAGRIDPAVTPLAAELLTLLAAVVGKGTLPTEALPAGRATAATKEIKRFKPASEITDSVALRPVLGWLIDPTTRPR
jgi:hypothetical protein